MEGGEACWSQRRWYNDAILVDDNAITAVQVLSEVVVFSEWWGELMFELG